MDNNKIIRSICYFAKEPTDATESKLNELEQLFTQSGYNVQTKRLCSPQLIPNEFDAKISDKNIILGVGSYSLSHLRDMLPNIYKTSRVFFGLNLTNETISTSHVQILFDMIKNNPSSSFNFAYEFNNVASSPYFPSAEYQNDGFSIGLQSTDLTKNCTHLEQWFEKMKNTWNEICGLIQKYDDFLGIDSSVAPAYSDKSSLINFIKRLNMTFPQSATTDTYLTITEYIKKMNPKPVGLCGLMLPCLEDFELADEYEKGEFGIERNVFMSLHSGLGIDVYPIGVDEKPERVEQILKLLQKLSNKYKKPLSCRFVSDGKAKISEKTDFQNQYLKDVLVRAL